MRLWNNTSPDDGSIHSLGNGLICAYAQGPDWIQVFGPPYSSPNQFSLFLNSERGLEVRSSRQLKSAIWRHQVLASNETIGTFEDFSPPGLACLIRQFHLSHHLRFVLRPAAGVCLSSVPQQNGGLLLQTPSGTFFYHTYPIPRPLFSRVLFSPTVHFAVLSSGDIELIFPAGETTLWVCGGPSYPDAIQNAERALAASPSELRNLAETYWNAYSAPHQRVLSSLPADAHALPDLIQAADDTAFLIQTQQDISGAVLAGHNYHMAYVRDQYGVSRGLLALGQTASARKILEFYWQVWQRHGRIHNAQAAGVDGAFHIHEFDGAEITGYLIQQAFDLQQATGDLEFTRQIFPMLTWAFDAQVELLAGGMLPFNGDETYIAGGILPRSAINDGSAEATLLFVESGRKLLNFALNLRLWSAERIQEARTLLHNVAGLYHHNFLPDGILRSNNPARRAATSLPAFRHGVCERCHAEGRSQGIEWTAKNINDRYLCPRCLSLGDYPAIPPTVYELQSVSLAPLYHRSSLLQPSDLRPTIEKLAAQFKSSGQLPSRPDDSSGLTVGYDYGLFLYALTAINHPLSREIFSLTLDRRDITGDWVEYYRSGKPQGTRCRPWESGINIEALLYTAGL